jgi:hypothetical protein
VQPLANRISAARRGQQQAIARNVEAGDEIFKDLNCSNSAANLYRDGKHAAFALAAFRPRFQAFYLGQL